MCEYLKGQNLTEAIKNLGMEESFEWHKKLRMFSSIINGHKRNFMSWCILCKFTKATKQAEMSSKGLNQQFLKIIYPDN